MKNTHIPIIHHFRTPTNKIIYNRVKRMNGESDREVANCIIEKSLFMPLMDRIIFTEHYVFGYSTRDLAKKYSQNKSMSKSQIGRWIERINDYLIRQVDQQLALNDFLKNGAKRKRKIA